VKASCLQFPRLVRIGLTAPSAEFDSQIAAFRVLFAMGELTTNTLGL
jgi:hypothetical protein